ncbi:MAG: hypothetical protein LBS05_03890 [Tannerellaceae bacterium]|jgi:hypothetical protein|nr:hypothetical protein [Tannerellaceae bacterium]
MYAKGTFGYDLQYLSRRGSMHLLASDDEQAQVIVSPQYQGKVFTSTVGGKEGRSLGFVNYKAFESAVLNEHMNGYGGENRLWIGPEGGRFSVFFKPGVRQVYDNWRTPRPFDTEPWQVTGAGRKDIRMEKDLEILNYMGTHLRMNVSRKVRLMDAGEIAAACGGLPEENLQAVAYATENTLTNRNDFEWTPQTGAVCIWILDMFCTAPRSFTIVPFVQGDERDLGPVATTAYFGEIPGGRYAEKDGCACLKTDGNFRSKIGLNSRRTKTIAGNYDPDSGHLAVAIFDLDRDAVYLNQEWDTAKDPLVGDVFNAYNDGPLADGSIMGPFLELESQSPAIFIVPGASMSHHHQVFHFLGEAAALNVLTKRFFNYPIL